MTEDDSYNNNRNTNDNNNNNSRFSRPPSESYNNGQRRYQNRRQNRYYKNRGRNNYHHDDYYENDGYNNNYNNNYYNNYNNYSYNDNYNNYKRRNNNNYNSYGSRKKQYNRNNKYKRKNKRNSNNYYDEHNYNNNNNNNNYKNKHTDEQIVSLRPPPVNESQLNENDNNYYNVDDNKNDYDNNTNNYNAGNYDNNNNYNNNNNDDYNYDFDNNYSNSNLDVASTLDIPDRSKKMLQELLDESYECLICRLEIGLKERIWSCDSCKTIFHLNCMNKWAIKIEEEEAKSQQRAIKDYYLINKTKCPICNTYNKNFKYNTYHCYCKKMKNPKFNSYVGIPHSCGEVCGKKRHPTCPHTCNTICHPGSCTKCNIVDLNNVSYCGCGKMKYTLKCGEVEVEKRMCGQICGKLLDCKNHKCKDHCHRGDCSPCDVKNVLSCFCGKVTKEISCGKDINGSFDCKQVCNKLLECGNHTCTLLCHTGSHISCKRRVLPVNICACGKTKLPNSKKRTSCLDPIPTCNKACDKMLNCKKHFCKNKCHDSKCPPCKKMIKKRCRCGDNTVSVTCGEYYTKLDIFNKNLNNNNNNNELPLNFDDTIFICKKKCKRIKSCGIHKCNTYCCKGKYQKNYDGHICRTRCMKPLNCGTHVCTNYCHTGPCNPCMVTYRDGLSCTCGYTRIEGPLLCGTQKLPTCPQPCSKQLDCGHYCNSHCHFGDCAKCLILVDKRCITHDNLVCNVQCYRKHVSCGRLCGKILKCGHKCLQSCGHLHDCNQIKNGCTAICNKKLPCGHHCNKKCRDHHNKSKSCSCNKQITVNCICGGRKEIQECRGRLKKDIHPPNCNDTCKIAQRNKLFREAFNISNVKYSNNNNNNNNNDNNKHSDNNSKKHNVIRLPYSLYLIKICLKEMGLQNLNDLNVNNIIKPSFIIRIENILKEFIIDDTNELLNFKKKYPKIPIGVKSNPNIKIYNVTKNERYIIYSMLPYYNLIGDKHIDSSNSKIFIQILKTKKARICEFLLSDAIIQYQKNKDIIETLESLPPECIIVIDDCAGISNNTIHKKLLAWNGFYRTWREKSNNSNDNDPLSLYLIFTNNELRNSALSELSNKFNNARKANERDSIKLKNIKHDTNLIPKQNKPKPQKNKKKIKNKSNSSEDGWSTTSKSTNSHNHVERNKGNKNSQNSNTKKFNVNMSNRFS